jgi:hypothetical protein
MKNKLRAGMGIKNPMVMVDPDKAEEKFEKMATSITASTGEEEEKEGACENVNQNLSDISKTIMERGMDMTTREIGMKNRIKNNTSSADVGDKGSVGSSGSDKLTMPKPETSTDIKIPPKGSEGVKPSKPDMPKKPIFNSYDPLSNKEILGISEKILKKNFNLGEEGYDIARDEGRVKPSKDKKDGTSYPPSEEMKKTQKVNKGPSAFEIVKKKYGKSVMDVDKKKKEKK